MVTFYIVRHGNTELNYREVLQGQIDSPLTKEGYEDANFLSKKFKKTKFDAIFSSDLGRAFTTAYIIADNIGYKKEIFRCKDFREIDYGDLTFKKKGDVIDLYNQLKADSNFKFKNGESHNEVKKRVLKKFNDIKGYKNVLVVSHNNPIRAILSEGLNKDFNSVLTRKTSHRFIAKFEVKNNKIINFIILNE